MRENRFLGKSSECDKKKEAIQQEGRGQHEEESLGERNVKEETNNVGKIKEAEVLKDGYKWSSFVARQQTQKFRCVWWSKTSCAGVNIKGLVSILTC
jgi:hypothetical protein